MTTFEQFVSEIDKLPKITKSFVYQGDSILKDGDIQVKAYEFRNAGETKEEAEEALMNSIKKFIDGKKAYVRVPPHINYSHDLLTGEDTFTGLARIAVIPE